MKSGPRAPLFLRRVIGPLLLTAAVAGAVLLVRGLRMSPLKDASHDWGEFAIGVAVLVLIVRIVNYLVFDVAFRLRRRTEAPSLLRELVALLVFSVGFALLLRSLLAVRLTAVLATSALITAVIGLALQDTLGNLFAGMALHLEKTLQVGDVVRVSGTVGFVEALSWRAVRIRTLLDSIVLLPNGAAAREKLEVYPRSAAPMASTIRIGLEYSLPPARAISVLKTTAASVAGVARVPPPRVFVTDFADFAIQYELRFWLEDYSWFLPVESAIRERLWYAFKREGITVPFPIATRYQYVKEWKEAEPPAPPDILDRVDLLRPLSAADREALRGRLVHTLFAAGEPVVEQGALADSLYVVDSGELAVLVDDGDGARVEVGTLSAGDAFGEMALLTGEPRTATVQARTEASLYRIDKDALAPLLKDRPQLAVEISRLMEGRRQKTQAALASTPRSTVAEDPGSLLSRIARYFGLEGLS